MVDDTADKFKQLASLFKHRDQVYEKATSAILDMLGPTVLEALYSMFNAKYEDVQWIEVQVHDGVLLIVASVFYPKDTPPPKNIELLSPATPEGSDLVGRVFRIGIPMNIVFTSKEEVSQYLVEATKKATTKAEQLQRTERIQRELQMGHDIEEEFDKTTLTKEQVQQIVMFQNATKGTKH